jgi:hypothetical protein
MTPSHARHRSHAITDNQFKAQEPGTDDEVLQFCQLNYGVTFPIAKKVCPFPIPAKNPSFPLVVDIYAPRLAFDND